MRTLAFRALNIFYVILKDHWSSRITFVHTALYENSNVNCDTLISPEQPKLTLPPFPVVCTPAAKVDNSAATNREFSMAPSSFVLMKSCGRR